MFISLDIGGTNTRVASSENLKDIFALETFPSQPNLAVEKEKIREAITKVSSGKAVAAYVIGIAGIIDSVNATVKSSPNYKVLNGAGVVDLVGATKDVPLYCLNDTKIAGLGEAILGAGSDYKSVGYMALGTGIGGCLINNKTLDDKSYEPGHHVINFDDATYDEFAIQGAYEAYASGTAFFNHYKMRPHECNDPKIWEDYGKKVAMGLQNIILLWNPDCIVLGGGMSKYFDNFMPAVNTFLANLNFISLPPIVKAKFDQGSGVVGGFVYLSQKGFHG